jgi:hypothetical protein
MKVKLGKQYKQGEKIPLGQYSISYWNDGTVTIGCETKYECESEGNTWELLNFEHPCKPKEPKVGEVWEVRIIGAKISHLRRYHGPDNHMRQFDGGIAGSPSQYEFIRRWEPCDED